MLLHALIAKLGAFRALFSNKIHAIPLRELTGLHLRADLVKRFGPHDDEHQFDVRLWQLASARPWWRWILGNVLIEIVLIALLIGTVFGSHQWGGYVIGVAIPYYAITHFIAIRGFKKSRAEVEEEIGHKQALRRARIMKKAI